MIVLIKSNPVCVLSLEWHIRLPGYRAEQSRYRLSSGLVVAVVGQARTDSSSWSDHIHSLQPSVRLWAPPSRVHVCLSHFPYKYVQTVHVLSPAIDKVKIIYKNNYDIDQLCLLILIIVLSPKFNSLHIINWAVVVFFPLFWSSFVRVRVLPGAHGVGRLVISWNSPVPPVAVSVCHLMFDVTCILSVFQLCLFDWLTLSVTVTILYQYTTIVFFLLKSLFL